MSTTEDTLLRVVALRHRYGSGESGRLAIDGVSFAVRDGEFLSIVGPSGCGKTTLMNCLSGLMRPTAGTVELDGRAVSGVPRNLALVFQDYSRSLFPWLTVAKNVAFPLTELPLPKAERAARVGESLDAVGLTGFEGYYPWQLSGGMQQRVAIARALAYRPRILLMDEPFGSVDAQTRADLEDLVLRVRRAYAMTILFVTHDIDESVYVADRVLVLSKSPASVVTTIDVPLPEARDQIETKELDEFIAARGEIARLILSRSQESPGSTTQAPHAELRIQ